MSSLDFKTHIEKIRKEALKLGYSKATMDGYLYIWNNFIKWKESDIFDYKEEDYINFLLEYYNFDVQTYTNKSKSHYQQLMRSKRILDDFDSYKKNMTRKALPSTLFNNYPSEWDLILNKYLDYLKNVRCNSINSIKIKKWYVIRLLSYFYQNKIIELKDINKNNIIKFINDTIDAGNVSKRRSFYILREFLNYLFIENVLNEDLEYLVPKIKNTNRKKLPTYLKQEEIDNILSLINRKTKLEIRDYTIILIAARLGLRISDILNIKLKDIDWKNYKIKVVQPKTNNLNVLPLSKEIGWAIIDYIKKSRPKCKNEYLFVKNKYPFEKMEHFNQYNKYFEKTGIEIEKSHKNGIHNLRHSFATNLLENEIPVDIIANCLGDATETTSNIK